MKAGGIEIRLYASLQKWKPIAAWDRDLGESIDVRRLLSEEGIPEGEVAIVMINGKRGRLESRVSEGDRLDLFPLIGGG